MTLNVLQGILKVNGQIGHLTATEQAFQVLETKPNAERHRNKQQLEVEKHLQGENQGLDAAC